MGFSIPLGIVAIGRNEGERLERCLQAAQKTGLPLIYVDSASSDESVERARRLGVAIIELDPTQPLSAARARNAGFRGLLERSPEIELVQFIDGDCEIVEGWLAVAVRSLDRDEKLGAVCGRRRERAREASPYNRLIDLEWDTPIGRTKAFGGDVLIRVPILLELDGYDETLIAGEDPDLAARVCAAGWEIDRLATDMTVHDADLSRFEQWWMRQVRAGHAAAEAWFRSSWSDTKNQRRVASILFWGGFLPLLAIATLPFGLLFLLAYPALGLRIYRNMRKRDRSPGDSALYAASCIEGKFAEFFGIVQSLVRRIRRAKPTLVEYK